MTMARSMLTGGLLNLLFPQEPVVAVERPLLLRFSVVILKPNGGLYIGHAVSHLDPQDWAALHGYNLLKAYHLREAGPLERTKLH